MSKKNKPRILVCTRGKKCSKKESHKVFNAIVQAAKIQNSPHEVVGCKCLGMCKKGPAVVVMPGKKKLRQVQTGDAPKLVKQSMQDPGSHKTKKKKKKRKKGKKK